MNRLQMYMGHSSRTLLVLEDLDRKLYPPVKEINTSPFVIAAGVLLNLNRAEARTRILQKIKAIESGLPELEYCYSDFFKPDEGSTRWKLLYQMLIDKTKPVQSLYCRSELSEAMESEFEITLQYYTELPQRPNSQE